MESIRLAESKLSIRERKSKLVKIARETLVNPTFELINGNMGGIKVFPDSKKQNQWIYILDHPLCTLSINSADLLHSAERLAKAYKQMGRSEFKIHKDYHE